MRVRFVSASLVSSTHGDRGRRLKAGALFTAAQGRKQADVNGGWRFHEAQLVDGRFNVTGLNWAMIRTVCKIHIPTCLCPPAPSGKQSFPSPPSYARECSTKWTRGFCVQFPQTSVICHQGDCSRNVLVNQVKKSTVEIFAQKKKLRTECG